MNLSNDALNNLNMKLVFKLSFFLFATGIINAQVWLVDPLEPIYPDINHIDGYSNKWTGDYPLGVVADIHVLVKVPKGEIFTVSAMIEDDLLAIKSWDRLIDVPVEQNTGVDSRTEQYKGNINPDVVRRAPFRIFEVIEPLTDNKIVSKSNFTALRLSISPSLIKQAGKKKVSIKITSNSIDEKATLILRVHPVEMPKLADSNFFYTNWFNLKRMEEQHKLQRWSEAWFEMLNKYASLMAYGRQNSITIPNELISYENESIVLDDEKMIRFINVFRDQGFKYFESPHLMNRGDNDDWGDPELKVSLTKNGYYKENGKEDIEQLMTMIKEFVIKNDLKDNWLQHVSDEPTSVNAKCYKDVVTQIKGIYPEIKIMEATNDRDGLTGAIDIWCPLINDFQENEAFFREREKLGEKVLVYTCLIPGGKWLNRTLDMEKLRQVYFGWGAAHYNTSGYLHWGLNQYQKNPFEQSVVHHPAPGAAENNFLPAGDTHIIYPGKDKPLSSLRFEAHRMGCEDFDLLQLLKKDDEKTYDKLVNTLFRSYTDYNLSIKDYRKTKRKLLKAL